MNRIPVPVAVAICVVAILFLIFMGYHYLFANNRAASEPPDKINSSSLNRQYQQTYPNSVPRQWPPTANYYYGRGYGGNGAKN
jgi:uncharacterized membrane protein YukC